MKNTYSLSVIIPVYKKTEMFLNNLRKNWKYLKRHEVIVIDDASGENLSNRLKEYPSVKCYSNIKNLGFGSSMNKGIYKASGDYLFFLNSDVVLKDDSYLKAIELLKKDRSLFAISFAQEENNEIVGKNILFWRTGLYQHSKADDMKSGYSSWAEGGSCIVRTEYIKELDGFDERFSPFYGEDIDLSLRALKKGWKVWFESIIKVIHKHESTIGAYYNKDYVESIALRNQVLYSWKNGSFLQKLSMIFFIPYYILYFIRVKKVNLINAYIKGWLLLF